jgi:hypothetical protein
MQEAQERAQSLVAEALLGLEAGKKPRDALTSFSPVSCRCNNVIGGPQ